MAETTPSFYLKEPGSTKQTPINFVMQVPGKDKPIKRSIGKSVLPGQWVFADQRVDAGRNKELLAINKRIDEIVEGIDGVKSDCRRNNRVIAAEDVEALLDVILQKKGRGKSVAYTPGDMQEDFEKLIQQMRDGKILTPGKSPKKYEESTMKNYDKLMRALFGKEQDGFVGFYKSCGITPSYSQVNLDLYNQFISWCHSMEYADNSIGVIVKCWKKLLKLSHKAKWHNNTFYSDTDFVKPEEEAADIYLDTEMLNQLALIELKDKEEIARDWALLDCHLGLRISDLKRIGEADFNDGVFQFVNQKTGAKVALPIHPVAKRILKRWSGPPPAMPDQHLNDIIKEVARKAGLKKRFLHKITRGGEVQSEWMEYWEMISAHTFRRTFITNLLKENIPATKVMKMAGIKDFDTLKVYDKESVEDNAEEMKRHAFFASPASARKSFQKQLKALLQQAISAGITKEQLTGLVKVELMKMEE